MSASNTPRGLLQRIWKQIFRNLHHQGCILILGPNLATIDDDQTILQGFANKLIEDLRHEGVEYEESDHPDLSYIGLRWLKGVPNITDNDLRYEFKDFCVDNTDVVPRIYRELAQLPFFLVINTAPDDFMSKAFEAAGKKSQLLHYNYQRNQSPLIPEMNEQNPVVYNLFGYYEKPESLVITKEDQVNFINGLLRNVSTLPNEIMQRFDTEKTYLFLGFDVNTWHLPLLFRSLSLHDNNSSFYLNEQQLTSRVLKDYYTDSFKFRFVDDNAMDFAQTLRKGYAEWCEENRAEPVAADKVAYINKPQPGVSGKVQVLIMTSAPKDAASLELNEEINMIEDAHSRSNLRNQFSVRPILDIKKRKMLEILLRQKPQIIHFSGHGSGSEGLLFYNDSGYSDMVNGEELAGLFRQFNDVVSCVVLNACYSESQATAIAKYIPNVIGTNNAIGDDVARTFSDGFYTALFNGETYEKAYQMAMAQVGLGKFPEGGRPVFYKDGVLVKAD